MDCNLEEAAKLSLYARRYQEIKDDAEALACIFMCAFCIGDIENRIAHIFPEKNEELKNAVHAGKKAGASGKSAMEEKAKKWSFGAGEGDGDGAAPGFQGSNGSTTNSNYAQSEMRKAAMDEKTEY